MRNLVPICGFGTHSVVQECPMRNSGIDGDGLRVLANEHSGTKLTPKLPRLGGDVLTTSARHIQAG